MLEQIFQSVFIAPCCFLKKISHFLKQLCQLFFAIGLLAALWMCEDIRIEILPITHWTLTCFSNGYKSTQTRCKVFSKLTSALQQLTFVLLVSFFINLEHLSHPAVVLLFILWKGKSWLKVRRKFFVKMIQWC